MSFVSLSSNILLLKEIGMLTMSKKVQQKLFIYNNIIQDCKVEFNQPFCWLYSVPNLLVFQQLVTLYLGGFVVRVVSEIECWILKSVQENRVSWLDLTGESQLQAARSSTRVKHARSWTVMLAGALQDKIGQLAVRLSRDWISRLSQVARPICEPTLF